MFFIGLAKGAAGLQQRPQQDMLRDTDSFAYAAFIAGGTFIVYESGKRIGEFGKVKAGSMMEIRLTSTEVPKVEYCVNKKILYTSSMGTSCQVPLFVKVYGRHRGPVVEDLQWILELAS